MTEYDSSMAKSNFHMAESDHHVSSPPPPWLGLAPSWSSSSSLILPTALLCPAQVLLGKLTLPELYFVESILNSSLTSWLHLIFCIMGVVGETIFVPAHTLVNGSRNAYRYLLLLNTTQYKQNINIATYMVFCRQLKHTLQIVHLTSRLHLVFAP